MKAKRRTKAGKQIMLGQPSWRLASSDVEVFVTETGGHVGPVTFDRSGRKIQPYSVAPWVEEETDRSLPPILKVLRGDFFCLPFGGNAASYRGERHPVHGETANGRWRFESLDGQKGCHCLHLSLKTKLRPGQVDKRIWLLEGQNVIYSRHVVTGMSGPMSAGHHAMLKFPDEPGSGIVSTSGFAFGQVFPGTFERPENGGYSWLKAGAVFRSLDKIPTITGEVADLTRYPARRGFEDLVLLVSKIEAPFAWTAVTFPKERYVWFALKDPRVLRETVFWLSNGGRHYAPWNGRHVNVMGLEEVCSWFHLGLAESVRQNSLSRKGVPTSFALDPERPLAVSYIMGVTITPPGFDRVISIAAARGNKAVVLRSANGRRVEAPVALDFLQGHEPAR